MELLLFIYALECGISGDVKYAEPSAIYAQATTVTIYAQAEAGVRINDAFLLIKYQTDINPDERMPVGENGKVVLSLFVDHEGWGFGGNYIYEIDTSLQTAELYARVQSW